MKQEFSWMNWRLSHSVSDCWVLPTYRFYSLLARLEQPAWMWATTVTSQNKAEIVPWPLSGSCRVKNTLVTPGTVACSSGSSVPQASRRIKCVKPSFQEMPVGWSGEGSSGSWESHQAVMQILSTHPIFGAFQRKRHMSVLPPKYFTMCIFN